MHQEYDLSIKRLERGSKQVNFWVFSWEDNVWDGPCISKFMFLSHLFSSLCDNATSLTFALTTTILRRSWTVMHVFSLLPPLLIYLLGIGIHCSHWQLRIFNNQCLCLKPNNCHYKETKKQSTSADTGLKFILLIHVSRTYAEKFVCISHSRASGSAMSSTDLSGIMSLSSIAQDFIFDTQAALSLSSHPISMSLLCRMILVSMFFKTHSRLSFSCVMIILILCNNSIILSISS